MDGSKDCCHLVGASRLCYNPAAHEFMHHSLKLDGAP